MIIVHETFVCKPGNASKLAKMTKEMMSKSKEFVNVMTDLTGRYHKVIMVSKYASLSAFEKSMEKWSKPTPEMKKSMEKFSDMQNMYTEGWREIYKVW
jgi:hypothetical protein